MRQPPSIELCSICNRFSDPCFDISSHNLIYLINLKLFTNVQPFHVITAEFLGLAVIVGACAGVIVLSLAPLAYVTSSPEPVSTTYLWRSFEFRYLACDFMKLTLVLLAV